MNLWGFLGLPMTSASLRLKAQGLHFVRYFQCNQNLYEAAYRGTDLPGGFLLSPQSTIVKAKRAMDLTGHRSGIYSFCFSADSTHAATVSKDGTWRVHKIELVVRMQGVELRAL